MPFPNTHDSKANEARCSSLRQWLGSVEGLKTLAGIAISLLRGKHKGFFQRYFHAKGENTLHVQPEIKSDEEIISRDIEKPFISYTGESWITRPDVSFLMQELALFCLSREKSFLITFQELPSGGVLAQRVVPIIKTSFFRYVIDNLRLCDPGQFLFRRIREILATATKSDSRVTYRPQSTSISVRGKTNEETGRSSFQRQPCSSTKRTAYCFSEETPLQYAYLCHDDMEEIAWPSHLLNSNDPVVLKSKSALLAIAEYFSTGVNNQAGKSLLVNLSDLVCWIKMHVPYDLQIESLDTSVDGGAEDLNRVDQLRDEKNASPEEALEAQQGIATLRERLVNLCREMEDNSAKRPSRSSPPSAIPFASTKSISEAY